MNKSRTIMRILGVIVVALVARYILFKDAIDQRGADLDKLGQREETYKAEHPGASKEEIDAAFKDGIDTMASRKENYKATHSGATDADADAALEEAFNKMDPK